MNKKKFSLLLKLKKVKKSRSIAGLNILNKEKTKLSNIQGSLAKILETAQFPEGEEMTSSFLRHISSYQNQIQDKLNTSLNRQKYLSNEILNSYLNDLTFTQGLKNKQSDIDELVSNIIEEEIKKVTEIQNKTKFFLFKNIIKFY